MVSPVVFMREVIVEMRKVSWPSRQQTQDMTLLVIVVSVAVGAYLGALDFIFAQIMTALI